MSSKEAGRGILVATMAYCSLSLYAIIFSKILPESFAYGPILRAIRNDNYYCFVLPLMPPILLFFVFFNWLGLKLHRHNTA